MRNIQHLDFDTQKLLGRIYKNSKHYETRQRSHCILLSFKGFSISQLLEIFDVHLNTIYNWLNGWEREKFVSLYRAKGQGRKQKLANIAPEKIRKLVKENPRQLRKVTSQIETDYGISTSVITMKRYIKKS
jgi:transposase